jgi:uncharacterized membrane protein (UPF0136 family)
MNPKSATDAAAASSILFLIGGWLCYATGHNTLTVIFWVLAVAMAFLAAKLLKKSR